MGVCGGVAITVQVANNQISPHHKPRRIVIRYFGPCGSLHAKWPGCAHLSHVLGVGSCRCTVTPGSGLRVEALLHHRTNTLIQDPTPTRHDKTSAAPFSEPRCRHPDNTKLHSSPVPCREPRLVWLLYRQTTTTPHIGNLASWATQIGLTPLPVSRQQPSGKQSDFGCAKFSMYAGKGVKHDGSRRLRRCINKHPES